MTCVSNGNNCRSHAGEVKTLAEKAFGSGYSVESAGGSGYKTLRLVNATAGEREIITVVESQTDP